MRLFSRGGLADDSRVCGGRALHLQAAWHRPLSASCPQRAAGLRDLFPSIWRGDLFFVLYVSKLGDTTQHMVPFVFPSNQPQSLLVPGHPNLFFLVLSFWFCGSFHWTTKSFRLFSELGTAQSHWVAKGHRNWPIFLKDSGINQGSMFDCPKILGRTTPHHLPRQSYSTD